MIYFFAQKHLGSIKGNKLDIQAYFHLQEKKSYSFSSLSYIFKRKCWQRVI